MLHVLGAAAAAWGGTLEAYALPLGTRLQLHTTSRDVRPGPCVRLDIRAHTPGMLALDVVADARRSSAGARLRVAANPSPVKWCAMDARPPISPASSQAESRQGSPPWTLRSARAAGMTFVVGYASP